MQILGLCKGRHDLPVDSYIFNTAIIPTDIVSINKVAFESLIFYKNDLITICYRFNRCFNRGIECM